MSLQQTRCSFESEADPDREQRDTIISDHDAGG